MPLRCLNPVTGDHIHAFDLAAKAWQALERANRTNRHLRMPCCSSPITLRKSKRGTQFFAHKVTGDCGTAPETETHLRLKQIAAEAARAHGWTATTEVAGITPGGEPWKADVLAQKDAHKVAIEIQWSSQTNDETMRRQGRYAQSGVRCLWLLRHPGFPVAQELPAARIEGNLNEGFMALVPSRTTQQRVSLPAFLDAAFGKRLHFGVPLGLPATVGVRAGYMNCWRDACGKRTRIITGVDITFGPHKRDLTVPVLGDYPDLVEVIFSQLPGDLGIGALKRRFSGTQARTYLSNGCTHCDALIGEFHEIDARYDEATVCEFPVRLSEPWREAIECEGYKAGWGVYQG